MIIPVYNRGSLVKEAIDSVLDQDFEDYEIIAVDDGSTDDSGKSIQQYGDQVRYFYQENMGEGAARNLGIQNAKGKYLAFLDSDDLWFTWTLSTFKRAIDENNYPSLLIGDGFSFTNEVELQECLASNFDFDKFGDYFESARSGFFCACAGGTVVLATKAREVKGFFPMRYNASDQDFVYKLGAVPGFIHITAPNTFAYRQHESNIVKNNDKNYLGISQIIDTETKNLYPGSVVRKVERLNVLTKLFRAFSVGLIQDCEFERGWSIYVSTFCWNLQLLRFKYIFGYPIFWVYSFFLKAFVTTEQNHENTN